LYKISENGIIGRIVAGIGMDKHMDKGEGTWTLQEALLNIAFD